MSLLVAGASQAATLKVELWDVIAGPSTCCAPNPTALAQKNARVAGTGSDTVLANLPNPFSANYLPQVNTIIGSEAASHIFDIDSDTLVSGFYVGGSTGLSNAGQTLNDFFGFDIDGAGSGIGNNSILGTILRITGYVDSVLSETYKVRADDGYSIAIGDASLVVNDGLQAPTTTNHSYNGSAGVNTFSLVWFDNQIVQTALKVEGLDFVTPVPLPAGLPLMAAGLGALAIAGRRKKSAKTAK